MKKLQEVVTPFDLAGGVLVASPEVAEYARVVYAKGKELFLLPPEVLAPFTELHCSALGTRGGYKPIIYERIGGVPTLAERHTFSHLGFDTDPLPIAGLREALINLHAALSREAYEVCQVIDRVCGTSLASELRVSAHEMQLVQYLNKVPDPSLVLYPPHRDYPLLTAFVGGTDRGLEAQCGGVWCPVQLLEGEVLFGVGTKLALHTPGVRPFVHQVRAHAARRFSIVQWIEPRPELVLINGETSREFNARVHKLISST